jgi:hypothetical protein
MAACCIAMDPGLPPVGRIVQNCPMDNVIRPPWRLSVSVPPDAQLWDVEGIPVAVIPIGNGGMQVQAFDSPVPRSFSRFSVAQRGRRIAKDRWDSLVNLCRSARPAWSPPLGRSALTGIRD